MMEISSRVESFEMLFFKESGLVYQWQRLTLTDEDTSNQRKNCVGNSELRGQNVVFLFVF